MRGALVLVVEDEPLIAMMLEDMLVELGCIVAATAAGVEAAVAMAATLELDFCVLDMDLAGKTSMPVLEVLQRRNLAVIVATGMTPTGITGLGAAIVLSKPFSIESLTAAIGQLRLVAR